MLDPERVHPNVLWGLLGLNLAVYVVWHTWGLDHVAFMRDHFMVSAASLGAGRVWTLLTSEFSHIDATHLLVNLLGLYVFGRPVEMVIGTRGLVGLYLIGAITASLGFGAWGLVTGSPSYALGASGAVTAIAVCFALWFPNQTLLIGFFIPMPAWLGVLLFIGLDVVGLFSSGVDGFMFNRPVQIAHSAHLGGAVAGLAVGLPVMFRLRAMIRRGEAVRTSRRPPSG